MNKKGGVISLIFAYFVFIAIFFLYLAGFIGGIVTEYQATWCVDGVLCFFWTYLNLWIFLAATAGLIAGVAFYGQN